LFLAELVGERAVLAFLGRIDAAVAVEKVHGVATELDHASGSANAVGHVLAELGLRLVRARTLRGSAGGVVAVGGKSGRRPGDVLTGRFAVLASRLAGRRAAVAVLEVAV